MAWNRVERHVGRLSHLTTVGLMLIQTQTWRREDYCRLLEHLLRKLFKEGIIQNIQQYLSALCTSALLLVAPLSPPLCLPAHWGGCEQGFMKDIYQLAFPQTKANQKMRIPKNLCETGARRVGGGVSRPYRWCRWVCFLHGCVVNDE